ncbi:eCIS core domain-containing protein [Methylomonas sp. MgM2]
MNGQTATQTQQQQPIALTKSNGLLQRKCACGRHTPVGGECEECAKTKRTLQRKLTIGAADDPLEREADRIADQVMAAPMQGWLSRAPVRVQRFSGMSSGQATEVPASVERVLASPGQPLESGLRKEMEGRFGYDFSRVRVHTGTEAEQSATDVGAHAYTVDHHLVFGPDKLSSTTNEGKHLLAHELAHVVQQHGVSRNNNKQRSFGSRLSSVLEKGTEKSLTYELSNKLSQNSYAAEVLQRQSIHNPLFPCYETSLIPGGTEFFGTFVHLAIQQHFVRNIDPTAATEYVIPGSGPTGGIGRADIVSSIGGIYEIKPAGLALSGFAEALAYLAQAEIHCDPHVNWHLGFIYYAPPITIGDYIIVSWLEGPGLILYALRRREREPRRVPETRRVPDYYPVPVTESARERITRWARRVYEEGLDATQAAEEFLQANPDLINYILLGGAVIILALIADDLSGVGIADDVLVPIVGALEWVALRLSFSF